MVLAITTLLAAAREGVTSANLFPAPEINAPPYSAPDAKSPCEWQGTGEEYE